MAQNADVRRSDTATCSGCPATWTGLAKAHCSGCHRTYSTAGLFTAHRIYVKGREVRGCAEPSPDMRLIDGVWRGPEFSKGALFEEAAS